jgi:hypothetical protein
VTKRSIQFLPAKQSDQLNELAERARLNLSRVAEAEVGYTAIGLQLLDEWIDRHTRQFPTPTKGMVTAWGAFLGQVFRERFSCEWAVDKAVSPPRLGLVCPREESGLLFVDIMGQVNRRMREGMSESLAFYYTLKGVEIKRG